MNLKPKSLEMKSALIGMILGDAYLRKTKTSKNAYMTINHGIKQIEYAEWKNAILQNITNTKIEQRMVYLKKENKSYPQITLITRTHPIYTKLHNQIYINGRKSITLNLLKQLTPLGMAIWYMDDGGLIFHKCKLKNGNNGIKSRELCLNTQSFSYEEHLIIQKYFKEVWDIDIRINKSKNAFRIIMNATNAKKFINIIEPYIIPSMQYKIDMKYKQ